eukprot:363216-Chlamydomonas_euryale.AAC.8
MHHRLHDSVFQVVVIAACQQRRVDAVAPKVSNRTAEFGRGAEVVEGRRQRGLAVDLGADGVVCVWRCGVWVEVRGVGGVECGWRCEVLRGCEEVGWLERGRQKHDAGEQGLAGAAGSAGVKCLGAATALNSRNGRATTVDKPRETVQTRVLILAPRHAQTMHRPPTPCTDPPTFRKHWLCGCARGALAPRGSWGDETSGLWGASSLSRLWRLKVVSRWFRDESPYQGSQHLRGLWRLKPISSTPAATPPHPHSRTLMSMRLTCGLLGPRHTPRYVATAPCQLRGWCCWCAWDGAWTVWRAPGVDAPGAALNVWRPPRVAR